MKRHRVVYLRLHRQILQEKKPAFHALYLRHRLNQGLLLPEKHIHDFIEVGWNLNTEQNNVIKILLEVQESNKLSLPNEALKRIAGHPDKKRAGVAQSLLQAQIEFESRKLLDVIGRHEVAPIKQRSRVVIKP